MALFGPQSDGALKKVSHQKINNTCSELTDAFFRFGARLWATGRGLDSVGVRCSRNAKWVAFFKLVFRSKLELMFC